MSLSPEEEAECLGKLDLTYKPYEKYTQGQLREAHDNISRSL